jgi:hypothetical protein
MKTTAFILLTVLLTTQTPFGQVLKLPLLIEHLYKHQKQGGLSLFQFLKDHYSHEHHDSDWPEDQQLPFKTIILCDIGFAIVPRIAKADFAVKFNALRNVVLNDVHKPQQHLCTIFHPPRISPTSKSSRTSFN